MVTYKGVHFLDVFICQGEEVLHRGLNRDDGEIFYWVGKESSEVTMKLLKTNNEPMELTL